jgi:3-dehydroquinate synthase
MTIIDRSAVDVVRVDLGPRSYDIRIGGGLVARAGELIAPVLKQKRAIIVTDTQVARWYLDELQHSLRGAGVASEAIVLPAG